ncbi:SPOR domain-containing protein [Vallitalea sp.]|jgi:cell division protein FtsN|uniref:SPOR domain-containing protein n=1 Tax=Vallitalea sp. TaxID=1882829 RepID=UPI0025D4E377|nr:SPOR domain-containing protein [Vallitalea sp.]MCT4688777.1 SPOR domain-containing protein [Vallitalea sp.]
MIKKVLISMLLLTLVLVGCQKKPSLNEMVNYDTTDVSKQQKTTDNNNDTESNADTETMDKIKELEGSLAEKDKIIDDLRSQNEDLNKKLEEKEEEDKKANTSTVNNGSSSSKSSTTTISNTAKKYYRVIVGSFDKKENATKLKEELLTKKIDAYVSPSNNKYRVIAGTFSQMKNATKRKDLVDKSGYNSFIVSE